MCEDFLENTRNVDSHSLVKGTGSLDQKVRGGHAEDGFHHSMRLAIFSHGAVDGSGDRSTVRRFILAYDDSLLDGTVDFQDFMPHFTRSRRTRANNTWIHYLGRPTT